MKPGMLAPQDLLYHPAHGLCRVDRVTVQERSGKKVACYSLVPRIATKMKVRFVIAEPDLEVSGFHRVISVTEARKILAYLRTGDNSASQTDQTWALARNILSFTKDKLNPRDQRKRQLLEHSVRGLVGEFSCVLEISLKEAVRKIEQSLGSNTTIHPLLHASLSRAIEN